VVLPVGLSGVRARGDAAARSALRGIWLQPVLVDESPAAGAGLRAASARRYGRMTVYAIAGAYLEPGGLWTAGGRTAELVVQVDPGQEFGAFSMRAGPATTPVRVRAGAFSLDADLAPGEERLLAIPVSPDGSAFVSIRTSRGFRPSEADSSSADTRLLGVRLEPR
jgi:hypothetical protein